MRTWERSQFRWALTLRAGVLNIIFAGGGQAQTHSLLPQKLWHGFNASWESSIWKRNGVEWDLQLCLHLWDKSGNPDDIVDRIWKEALEHISLPVDLPVVNYPLSKVIFSDTWILYKVINSSNTNYCSEQWSLAFLQFLEWMKKVGDIPGINFVEQRHEDEDIKDHSEVNVACSRLGTPIIGIWNREMSILMNEFTNILQCIQASMSFAESITHSWISLRFTCYSPAVYIKHFLSIEKNKEDHCELVECLRSERCQEIPT